MPVVVADMQVAAVAENDDRVVLAGNVREDEIGAGNDNKRRIGKQAIHLATRRCGLSREVQPVLKHDEFSRIRARAAGVDVSRQVYLVVSVDAIQFCSRGPHRAK